MTKFQKLTRTVRQMKRSYVIALSIIALAGLWVLSGQFSAPTPGMTQAIATNGDEDVQRLTRARVKHIKAALITSKVVIQGETRPNRSVDIKAEVRGPITETTKERGAHLVKGEPLFTIADIGLTEQLEKAKAAVALRQAQFEAAQSLAKNEFNTRIHLTETLSDLTAAKAELKMRQIDVDNLVVRAPFDGVLNDRLVEEGDFVETGTVLGKVVELDPIKIVGQISEANIPDIHVGMTAQITLVDGRRFPARLAFISSTSDTQTRTFEIELKAANPDWSIVGGLTATIALPTGEHLGHFVSPSVLTLSDDGAIGVKIVDKDSRVRFMPVTILEEDPKGTWIGGLPKEVDLITVGQDFVADGERVERVYVETAS